MLLNARSSSGQLRTDAQVARQPIDSFVQVCMGHLGAEAFGAVHFIDQLLQSDFVAKVVLAGLAPAKVARGDFFETLQP